ncbi:MAG: hypothetical protein JXA13_02825 [Anaerolineales bacterium]|nr:hypothetical protein [Anaerolineales bacterium]
MPKRKYPFEPDGPERVEISWEGSSIYPEKNIRVSFDGEPVGDFSRRVDLAFGKTFKLPDKSQLSVKLAGNELQVSRNGQSLAGFEARLREARSSWIFLAIAGIFEIALAGTAVLRQASFPTGLNITSVALVGGLILSGLAYWAWTKSRLAFPAGEILIGIQIILLQAKALAVGQPKTFPIILIVAGSALCILGGWEIYRLSQSPDQG